VTKRILSIVYALALLLTTQPLWAQVDKSFFTGVAGPAISLTYAFVAQDAGMWKKHGLDTKVIVFEAGSTLAQVARSGDVKFAINSGPTTIAARTQGADSVIIAAVVNTLPYSLVTAKGITNWRD
jgi:NitT/TauT family transport system substrate-binding protein